jgi:hypothetical protein
VVADTLHNVECEVARELLAMDGEMKVLLMAALVLLAAATALAYGHVEVATGVSAEGLQSFPESAALLLSGSVLIGVAGAVRRMTL